VDDVESVAHEKARAMPRLGRFIATLVIPDHTPIRIEKTGSSPSHFTLWAEPTDLLACVVSIAPVSQPGVE